MYTKLRKGNYQNQEREIVCNTKTYADLKHRHRILGYKTLDFHNLQQIKGSINTVILYLNTYEVPRHIYRHATQLKGTEQ